MLWGHLNGSGRGGGGHPSPPRQCYVKCLFGPPAGGGRAFGVDEVARARWEEATRSTIQVITKPCPKCRTPTERDGTYRRPGESDGPGDGNWNVLTEPSHSVARNRYNYLIWY